MDSSIVCSKCGSICTHNPISSYGCPTCGTVGPVIIINNGLCKAVKLLIKLGIGVIDTYVRYYTTHVTKIKVFLAGNIPDGLFLELPDD